MKLLLLLVVVYVVGDVNFVQGENLRIVRRAGGYQPLGGYRDLDLGNATADDRLQIKEAVTNAVKIMNDVKTERGTNNEIPLRSKSVKKASRQIVAGVNYKLELEIFIDGQNKLCVLKVFKSLKGDWSVSTTDITDPCSPFTPNQSRQKRSFPLVGGENAANINDDMVQQAALWAMQHINRMSNSLFMQGLLKITQVTKQVVNGLRYHFLLTTVSTSCRNKPENHHKTIEECPVADDPKPQDCDVTVIYSLGGYTMQSFKCKPRKGAIGGDNHDYIPHGSETVKHMNILGGDTHDYMAHGTDAVKNMNILGGDTHDYLPHTDDKCAEHMPAFKEFKSKYNRLYGSANEEALKFKVFCENMEKVKIIQAVEQGSAQYGATQFADLTEEEFKKHYLGFKPPVSQNRQWPEAQIPEGPIPESWDWRDHGAVTPVKNQGWCGSCWAFSTTGNIEGQWAIQSKNLLSLSEQELVDCDKLDQGCNGGFMYDAYEAIMELGGIETESDYKYTGKDGKCHFDKSEVVVKLTGAVNISKDEGEMAAWLYKNGPIAIGINSFPMQFYLWGIAHPWKFFCDPNALDHGVLIVGYGKKGKEPYWIIKNSWGPRWGRDGYYYIYRGDGSCGLNTMCSSATVN